MGWVGSSIRLCVWLGMGSVCGMAFGARDGVCVLGGWGWGVGWLGMGYVCGIACEAWDGVCVWFGVWYNQWGLGWGMCVVWGVV